MLKGISLATGREVERGKGWVALHPGFFVHDVVGGVYGRSVRSGGAGGKDGDGESAVSAAVVCEAVIG